MRDFFFMFFCRQCLSCLGFKGCNSAKSCPPLTGNSLQVYKNFVLANEYQSSKLCEALYTKCEDKMDRLQVLRLPSMAKFNAGFLHCNQSFERECVGPSKISYERRMMKVCIFAHCCLFFLIFCKCVSAIENPLTLRTCGWKIILCWWLN